MARIGCLIFLIISLTSFYVKSVPVGRQLLQSEDLLWKKRVNMAWGILQSAPCRKLQYGESCTELRSRSRREMTLYTAKPKTAGQKLSTILVERIKGTLRKHDIVLVVDPFPEAHYGHTIIVFLIDFTRNKAACKRKGTFYSTGNSPMKKAEKDLNYFIFKIND